MLLASDCLSIMPRSMMVGDLLRGTLKVVPLPVPAPPRPAGIILPAEPPPSPATAAFVAALRGFVAELSAHGLGDMPEADSSDLIRDRTRRPRRA
jgi:LysR family pca operon transcriptional activator